MDFNKELQELINKANQNGYDFKDGKFERTKELKFPVMEEFLIDNSTEESTGYWKIFKKTVRISEEDYKIIVDYAKNHNSEDIRCNCTIDIDDFSYEIKNDDANNGNDSDEDNSNNSSSAGGSGGTDESDGNGGVSHGKNAAAIRNDPAGENPSDHRRADEQGQKNRFLPGCRLLFRTDHHERRRNGT